MICYLLVPRPYLLRTPCLSINRVWERDKAWLAFWRRVGYQAYICTRLISIVDIIALHSIAINNSWYTLVLHASQTYMYNIELQLDCERGTHVGSKT